MNLNTRRDDFIDSLCFCGQGKLDNLSVTANLKLNSFGIGIDENSGTTPRLTFRVVKNLLEDTRLDVRDLDGHGNIATIKSPYKDNGYEFGQTHGR